MKQPWVSFSTDYAGKVERLYAKQQTRRMLSDVIEQLPSDTMRIGSAYNYWGDVHLTLIFARPEDRQQFLQDLHYTWVITDDRANFLDYYNTWHDVNGAGLMLGTTDYPLRAYGGKRVSELRPDRKIRRMRATTLFAVLAKLEVSEMEFLRDEFLRVAESTPDYPKSIDEDAISLADLVQDVLEISSYGHTTTERTES